MRYDCLVISILCFTIAIFIANAMQARTAIYATANISSGLGYDPGPGLYLDHVSQFGNWQLRGFADVTTEPKIDSESGYHADMGIGGAYSYRGLYAGAGYGWMGYRYEFDDDRIWKKSAWRPHIQAGYETERINVGLRFYPRETQTKNETVILDAIMQYGLTDHWSLMVKGGPTWFDQGGERDMGWRTTLGIGWKF